MADSWKTLVSAATAGTERIAPSLADGGVESLLVQQVDISSRETALLSYAAIVSLTNLAGFQPNRQPQDEECEPEAPAENKPYCGHRTAGLLASMLSGKDAELIPEWLMLAIAKARLIPAELLPDLFELGRTRKDIRPAVAEASGARGRWLARHNPEWHWVISNQGEAPEEQDAITELWETGSVDEREALFRVVRSRDAKRAREMLESAWKTDAAEARARFINAVSIGLTHDDEPFLESALDDRRKEIRTEAVELLATLPNSRLCSRMRDRARGLLDLKRAFLRADSLVVQLPEACDAAMMRDGIDSKPPNDEGLGERAWWLLQILGFVSPRCWSDLWGKQPAHLIEAALRQEEWKDVIIRGWIAASRRHRDAEWQEALLKYYLEDRSNTKSLRYVDTSAIPDQRIEPLLTPWISQTIGDMSQLSRTVSLARHLLTNREMVWSLSLSRLVTRTALMQIRTEGQKKPLAYEQSLLLNLVAAKAPASLAPEITPAWTGISGGKDVQEPAWERTVNEFLDRMRFRLTIHQAFEQEVN